MTRPPRVLGVVVAFHPTEEIREHLRVLARQVERVVVVDNTPGSGPVSFAAANLPPNVSWRPLGDNRGIARALNVGVDEAEQERFDWLVAFDQDTGIEEGYVARLLARAGSDPGVGMVVPRLASDRTPAPSGEVRRAITSGSLTRVAAFARAGPYREEFFIDAVDFEFCIRLRRAGYRILQDGDTVLRHAVGSPRAGSIAGVQVVTSNHAAVRRYYKVRNRVVLVREHFLDEPAWLSREILSTGWEVLKVLLLEEDRGEKLSMMARGAVDGLRGRLGRWPR
jgi:rhamnosyltransferase